MCPFARAPGRSPLCFIKKKHMNTSLYLTHIYYTIRILYLYLNTRMHKAYYRAQGEGAGSCGKAAKPSALSSSGVQAGFDLK